MEHQVEGITLLKVDVTLNQQQAWVLPMVHMPVKSLIQDLFPTSEVASCKVV